MKMKQLYNQYLNGDIEKHDYIKAMHARHESLFEYLDYIRDSDVEEISINNDEIVMTMKNTGIRMVLDPHDSRFIPIEILNFKSFDPVERGLVFKMAENSRVIFDIGANIGWYSLNFSQLENVEKLYSFEPIPRTFSFLEKHLRMNQRHNVVANNFALSDSNGTTEFFWTELETGSASMRNIQSRENINKVTCQTRKLDDVARQYDTAVDMIKCDVEGSELLVFKGGLETIHRDRPFVFTEMLRKWSGKFGYHPNEIIKIFSDAGYLCFGYDASVLLQFDVIDEETMPTNFFFLHKDKHGWMIDELAKVP